MASLDIDATELINALNAIGSTFAESIETAVGSVTADMELYAKQNAPWTDRTGNARRTMTGFTLWENENVLVAGVSGHMPYSPKLELNYGGRFRILLPTLDRFSPDIVTHIANAVMKLGGQANE